MFSRIRCNAGPSREPFFQIQSSRRSLISPRAPLQYDGAACVVVGVKRRVKRDDFHMREATTFSR